MSTEAILFPSVPNTTTADIHGAVVAQPTYRARLATSSADLMKAFKLRFEVFNLELGEGLATSLASRHDIDLYDAVFDHIIVEHCASEMVVGTYRLQTGGAALEHEGYYSEQEFNFDPYLPLRHELIELGRACVHKHHRNGVVLGLLWRAIAEYAVERRCRYLIGCSSLSTQDPSIGAAAFARLRDDLVSPALQTTPKPGFQVPGDNVEAETVKLPRILRSYLSVGAKICGPPAIDREFGTIDFLTLLDLRHLTPRAHSFIYR